MLRQGERNHVHHLNQSCLYRSYFKQMIQHSLVITVLDIQGFKRKEGNNRFKMMSLNMSHEFETESSLGLFIKKKVFLKILN